MVAKYFLNSRLPKDFRLVKDGECDLAFSGHTHGGVAGFTFVGLQNWTFIRLFSSVFFQHVIPDNGMWSFGSNLLFVSRGTGFYGNPLRLGVSGELPTVRVHFD